LPQETTGFYFQTYHREFNRQAKDECENQGDDRAALPSSATELPTSALHRVSSPRGRRT
jgi:hypothetical protein